MKVEQMLHEEVLQNTYPIMVNNLATANEKILRGMVFNYLLIHIGSYQKIILI